MNYIVQFIQPMIQGLVSSFEVKPEANDAYNAGIQKKLSTSVWNKACTSWYRTRHSETRKIFSPWPGTMTEYWWRMRNPIWSHYKVDGGEKWVRRRRMSKFFRILGFFGFAAVITWGFQHQGDLDVIYTRFMEQVRIRQTNKCRAEC